MQGIFQKENTDKALKYGIYRHLPTYEKIIRNLVSFYDKKQVTFADIAEYTNFSKTTISRYFNHPDSLTVENQEKISQALDTLGYKKNKLAKVLANVSRSGSATLFS